jgi:hypothetical protein
MYKFTWMFTLLAILATTAFAKLEDHFKKLEAINDADEIIIIAIL